MSTITSGMKSARSTRLGGGGDLTAAVADSVEGEGAEGGAAADQYRRQDQRAHRVSERSRQRRAGRGRDGLAALQARVRSWLGSSGAALRKARQTSSLTQAWTPGSRLGWGSARSPRTSVISQASMSEAMRHVRVGSSVSSGSHDIAGMPVRKVVNSARPLWAIISSGASLSHSATAASAIAAYLAYGGSYAVGGGTRAAHDSEPAISAPPAVAAVGGDAFPSRIAAINGDAPNATKINR